MGYSQTCRINNAKDIYRAQLDLFAKASTKKFNQKLAVGTVNLIAIDCTDLELGMFDKIDALLVAAGNSAVQHYFGECCVNEAVVGFFEDPHISNMNDSQQTWMAKRQEIPLNNPHPGAYIHGVMFLFRRAESALALSYDISQIVVWNSRLTQEQTMVEVKEKLARIIPFQKK